MFFVFFDGFSLVISSLKKGLKNPQKSYSEMWERRRVATAKSFPSSASKPRKKPSKELYNRKSDPLSLEGDVFVMF